MWTTLTTTVKTLVRTPAVVIWCLVFPLVLTGMFMMMFSGLSSDGTVDPVEVAVVRDDTWDASMFSQVVDAVDGQDTSSDDESGSDGSTQLLHVIEVDDEAAGIKLIEDRQVAGMYTLDDDGMPVVTLPPDNYSGSASMGSLSSTILTQIADGYVQNYQLLYSAIEADPQLLANPDAVSTVLSVSVDAEQFSPTRAIPDETVRYYYVLLAMVSLLAGTQCASGAVCQLQPNITQLGARRSIAGTSHVRQLLGLMLGCWLVATVCTMATFLFIRFVVGVDFGGREPLCLLGLAAASLCATALGALVAALPIKGGADTRSGLLIAVTMGLCVFAGLFGTASMTLSDALAQTCPATAWLNPPRLISDMFYSLYYYDSLDLFILRSLACCGLAAVMFGVSTVFFRRQRYEHL